MVMKIFGVNDSIDRVQNILGQAHRDVNATVDRVLQQLDPRIVATSEAARKTIEQLNVLEQQAHRDVRSTVDRVLQQLDPRIAATSEAARKTIEQLNVLEQQANQDLEVLIQRTSAITSTMPFVSQKPFLFWYGPRRVTLGQNYIYFLGNFPNVGTQGYTPKFSLTGGSQNNPVGVMNGTLIFSVSFQQLPEEGVAGRLVVPWGPQYRWFGKMVHAEFPVMFWSSLSAPPPFLEDPRVETVFRKEFQTASEGEIVQARREFYTLHRDMGFKVLWHLNILDRKYHEVTHAVNRWIALNRLPDGGLPSGGEVCTGNIIQQQQIIATLRMRYKALLDPVQEALSARLLPTTQAQVEILIKTLFDPIQAISKIAGKGTLEEMTRQLQQEGGLREAMAKVVEELLGNAGDDSIVLEELCDRMKELSRALGRGLVDALFGALIGQAPGEALFEPTQALSEAIDKARDHYDHLILGEMSRETGKALFEALNEVIVMTTSPVFFGLTYDQIEEEKRQALAGATMDHRARPASQGDLILNGKGDVFLHQILQLDNAFSELSDHVERLRMRNMNRATGIPECVRLFSGEIHRLRTGEVAQLREAHVVLRNTFLAGVHAAAAPEDA